MTWSSRSLSYTAGIDVPVYEWSCCRTEQPVSRKMSLKTGSLTKRILRSMDIRWYPVVGGASEKSKGLDIQTGESSPDAACEVESIKEAIRNEFTRADAKTALGVIAAVWKKLDEAVGIAEAKTRLLLARIEPPALLDKLPDWVSRSLDSLAIREDESIDSDAAGSAAVESTRQLISAFLARIGSKELKADIDRGPGGRFIVDWHVEPHRLQWMVGNSDLPWPGVLVNVLTRKGQGENALRETRIFHDAFGFMDFCVGQTDQFRP